MTTSPALRVVYHKFPHVSSHPPLYPIVPGRDVSWPEALWLDCF